MSYYFKLGQIPHKRHTQFRQQDGSLYHEELMGLRGFSGAKSLLYHLRPPTEVSNIAGSCPVDDTRLLDNCNTCTCRDGRWACTEMFCGNR